jgi:hypothetical protein
VTLVAAGACSAVIGGLPSRPWAREFSLYSPWTTWLTASLLGASRQLWCPEPSLFRHVRVAVAAAARFETTLAVMPAWAGVRLAAFLVAYLAVASIGYAVKVPFRVSENEFVNLPARWDAGWYLGIAMNGYRYHPSRGQQNIAFMPAFPVAMRMVAKAVGADAVRPSARPAIYVWSGVAVSLAALYGALVYLYRLARARADDERARAAVVIALVYPAAFVYNAPYTEAVFLLCATATFYHVGRSEPGRAAVWGLLAGLARPNGFLLSGPLMMIALARAGAGWSPRLAGIVDRLWNPEPRGAAAWHVLAASMPLAGVLLFSAYVYGLTGDPLAWLKLHEAWGRQFAGTERLIAPVLAVSELGFYGYSAAAGYELFHVLFFLFAIVLALPIAVRLGLAYAAYILLTVFPPVLAGGWLSMARITAVLFPLYLYLGLTLPASTRTAVVVGFAILQALGTALFFTWRPFY